MQQPIFDPTCKDCPRLAAFLEDVKRQHPSYYAKPVPPFGVARPRLLIVGLAPGMHGANATGRPFTGDHAGILLYKALYRNGLSNLQEAVSADDALRLRGCRITNAVKCLPPKNKPTTREIINCNRFLHAELLQLPRGAVILALGAIAHRAVLRALAMPLRQYPFGHGKCYAVADSHWLLDSYHCSRYNTQTRRLTEEMFIAVLSQAMELAQT